MNPPKSRAVTNSRTSRCFLIVGLLSSTQRLPPEWEISTRNYQLVVILYIKTRILAITL
jgi:hypothetical protein